MVNLTRGDDVFVLDLGDGENRFNPDSVAAINAALDVVEAAAEPRALVTVASGKVWSNGLDLEWIIGNAARAGAFVESFQVLLSRMLTLPVPAVAALQGHTFAGGAMFALAHDIRVMRADRGYLCLPEVDIKIPFTPGMARLIQSKLTTATAHEAMTTGRRYGGSDAVRSGLVDAAVEQDAVRTTAVTRAAALAGKDGATLGAIKRQMYEEPAAALALPLGGALAALVG